jgi:hypothetical protein
MYQDRHGDYHSHYCLAMQREYEEYRQWKIAIGDPYFATDPDAYERRLRYLRSKKLIP